MSTNTKHSLSNSESTNIHIQTVKTKSTAQVFRTWFGENRGEEAGGTEAGGGRRGRGTRHWNRISVVEATQRNGGARDEG